MKRWSILLLPMIAGCAGEVPPQPDDPGQYIAMTARTTSTRGLPLTSVSQIPDFGMFCFHTGDRMWADSDAPARHYNRRLARSAITGRWEYADGDPAAMWSARSATDDYTFFAYAPFATGEYDPSLNGSGNGLSIASGAEVSGTPRLRYTVPERVESQPDLLVAMPRYDLHASGHPVTMIMNHALTAVGFRLAGDGERITGISLQGVATSGQLALDGGDIHWNGLRQAPSLDRYAASVAFDDGESYFTAGPERDLLAGDGWLMMIPQRLSDGALVRLDFDDGTFREFSLNIFTWLPGRQAVYRIDLNEDTGIGAVTVAPETLSLSYGSQFPVAQILEVDCETALGNKAYDVPWRLTSDSPWLTLSLVDQPGSGTSTVFGTGSRTVRLFAQMNPDNVSRQANIFLGDPAAGGHVLCTVGQAGMP
jgi:hypothetical protein